MTQCNIGCNCITYLPSTSCMRVADCALRNEQRNIVLNQTQCYGEEQNAIATKLTFAAEYGYIASSNTPGSFGERARSRFFGIGSCFFLEVAQ